MPQPSIDTPLRMTWTSIRSELQRWQLEGEVVSELALAQVRLLQRLFKHCSSAVCHYMHTLLVCCLYGICVCICLSYPSSLVFAMFVPCSSMSISPLDAVKRITVHPSYEHLPFWVEYCFPLRQSGMRHASPRVAHGAMAPNTFLCRGHNML